MSEGEIEMLEKAFPKGFLCISVMKNNTIHVSMGNPLKSEILHNLRTLVMETLDKIEEEQTNGTN